MHRVKADKISGLLDSATPQSVAAVCRIEQCTLEQLALKEKSLLIICDSIRDPGNFGAITRTAAAAGCDAVIAGGEGVDPWSPKTVRGGMGAAFRIPVIACSGPSELKSFLHANGFEVFLADMGGKDIFSMQAVGNRLAIIIGGEAAGAGSFSEQLDCSPLSIPMPGGVESLNAAVAAGTAYDFII